MSEVEFSIDKLVAALEEAVAHARGEDATARTGGKIQGKERGVMINLEADRRITEFMDKWRQAFKADADILQKTPKTEAFFADATALRDFLMQKGGAPVLSYALRVMAAIPGVTAGLRQTFAMEPAAKKSEKPEPEPEPSAIPKKKVKPRKT